MITLGNLNWNQVDMIVSLLGGLINKYLREYFEDIDASQLGGSFFGGDLNLKNLKLRPNVFEKLGFPFQVVSGKCGSLEVQYSLFKLYSEPIVIKLKDLHVLACPSKLAHYDETEEKLMHQQEKLRQLEEYERVKSHLAETHKHLVASSPPQITTYEAWVNSIIRNINVTIESIHFRFEDEYTKIPKPFAAGVTIQNLQVLSTDSSWKTKYVKDYVPETIFKLIKLEGLCVYWNPAPTHLFKSYKDTKKLSHMLATLPKADEKNASYASLIGPVTIDIKIQITLCPDSITEPFSKPIIKVEVSHNDAICTVSDKQVKDILPYIETLRICAKTLKFRKYRPVARENNYKSRYREWWKFAYNCVLEDIHRRRKNFTWDCIKSHREKCWKYLKYYYKKKVNNVSSPELNKIVADLEEGMDLFNIILLRKHVELIQHRESKAQERYFQECEPNYVDTVVNGLLSWFSYPHPEQLGLAAHTRQALYKITHERSKFSALNLTQNEKKQLKIAVAFAKNVYCVNYPADYNNIHVAVHLDIFQLKLGKVHDCEEKVVLDMLLHDFLFEFSSRPVNSGLLLEMKMSRVEAYGGENFAHSSDSTRKHSFTPPQLLTTTNIDIKEHLIKFLYEKAPLDSEVDHKIWLEALGLHFIYQSEAITRLIDFFTIKHKGEPKIIGTVSAEKILKSILNFDNAATNSKFINAMKSKGKVELKINLISPHLVIPQGSLNKTKASFFVVELGEINLVGTVKGGTICEQGTCSSFV